MNGQDEISLSFYSDIMDHCIECGNYSMGAGYFTDFKDLEIPCNDYVIVGIRESDDGSNKSQSVQVACTPGAKSVDLVVAKGESLLGTILVDLAVIFDLLSLAYLGPQFGIPMNIMTDLTGAFVI